MTLSNYICLWFSIASAFRMGLQWQEIDKDDHPFRLFGYVGMVIAGLVGAFYD